MKDHPRVIGVISKEEAAKIAAEHAEQYLNSDDDEESPLGASIFFSKFGYTIDDVLDVLDAADEED